jgi:hypothetical protein
VNRNQLRANSVCFYTVLYGCISKALRPWPQYHNFYMTDYTTFTNFVNIYMSKSFGMKVKSLSNRAHNDAQCEFFTA